MDESENKNIQSENPQDKVEDSIIVCPSCRQSQNNLNKFCEKCGQNFASEKIKSPRKTKRDLKAVNKTRERRKHQTHINDGRILIFVIVIASFAFYLFQINYVESVVIRILENSENENLINYYKMLSFIPIGMGVIYLGIFFWSFKNIFAALLTAFSIFFIETGIVICFSGVRLHPLYLIFKAVVIIFLIIAIKASIKLKTPKETLNSEI